MQVIEQYDRRKVRENFISHNGQAARIDVRAKQGNEQG